MAGFVSCSNVRYGDTIALFGPQHTQWTHEGLTELQSALSQDSNLTFVAHCLARLSSLWPLLQGQACLISGFLGEERLRQLEDFAGGREILDPQKLSNSHLAPLTVVSHVIDVIRVSGRRDKNDSSLPGFGAAQGFCIGFLSAAALASSDDWMEFERNVSNSIRLAACIGIIIDAVEEGRPHGDRVTATSVRWRHDSERTYLETCLDGFPNAYVSCITDEKTLTITLPKNDLESFCSRLKQGGLVSTFIGLDASYHHPRHAKAAQTLERIAKENTDLRLPDSSRLHLPLRSTADAAVITARALHEVAIEAILCKRAHWFQTVRSTTADLPLGRFELISFGKDSCIPRSLLTKQTQPTHGAGYQDNVPDRKGRTEEVAVVGMACRFPQADSIEEFWQVIKSGRTAIGKLPDRRFHPGDISREPKLASFWGNFLRQPDVFDHRFFDVSGREAKSMDPQQRLVLQVAYEALESSGYCSLSPERRETDVACYLGVGSVDYEGNVASEDATAFSATGTLRAFISGRISHFFGWSGPSITFDTACSSSAVAIHTACQALLGGECSTALAGGVHVITGPNLHQNLAAASFLNPDGASRAFDADAHGYCRGEGAGLLVLKKLSKAVADGDTVLGVIAASAVNQGSNCSPITVPDSQSQRSLYTKVLAAASIEPKDVSFVEAHGTGTPVGDPIEYDSVRLALTGPWRSEELFLGSVKDNIGHTEAASGVAAVIKTLLMMQHQTIAIQANFNSLNPRIRYSASDRIAIPKATRPWIAERHVALVNNYGAAGSNAAIALRRLPNAPSSLGEDSRSQRRLASSSGAYPIMISAKSANSTQMYMDALKSYLAGTRAPMEDIAYNLARRQNPLFEFRIVFTAGDAGELTEKTSEAVVRVGKQPVILCFGGQTGNHVTVSKDLYDRCDLFRKHLDECDMVCRNMGLPGLYPDIFQTEPTEDVVSLHCKLLSLQIACARCWLSSGLEVDTLIGHSFGQLAALCVADSISIEDTFRFVSGRAALIRDVWGPERGVMLSVECDREEVEVLLDIVNAVSGLRVDVACYNGARSYVLAGNTVSMIRVEEECKSFKTNRLQNTHAYHSYVADGIMDRLRDLADSIRARPPRIHVETCSAHGNWQQFTTEKLVQHTRHPVYFADAVERIAARVRSAVWLEAGSKSPIVAMARRIVRDPERPHTFISLNVSAPDATEDLAQVMCQLWKAGCSAQHWLFHRSSHQRFQYLNLPPYQFERVQHWIEYKPRVEPASSTTFGGAAAKDPSLVELVEDGNGIGQRLFRVNTSDPVFELGCRGHAVAGQSICPASLYIEIATQCAVASSHTTSLASTPPHIKAVTMSAPLGLDDGSTVFMRLCGTADNAWDFTMFSQPSLHKGSDEGPTEHTKGHISLVSANDGFVQSRLSLLERFARSSRADRILATPSATGISGPIVYELFSEFVDYADYYRGVQSVHALEHEAVGHVTVPRDMFLGMSSVLCEPIPLDNFLQVAGVHVNRLSQRRKGEVFMCTAVDEMILSKEFLINKGESRTWTVYSQYDRISKVEVINNILVYEASSKSLIVAIMGARFRSVPMRALVRTLTKFSTASAMATDVSESNSERPDDSGYQSCSPTPPDDEHTKIPSHATSLRDPAIAGTTHPKASGSYQLAEASDKLSNFVQGVREMISEILEIPLKEIEPGSKINDLGIDSLLVTEVLAEIDKRFHIKITQARFQQCLDVLSLGQCISSAAGNANPQTFGAKSTDQAASYGNSSPASSSNEGDVGTTEHSSVNLAAVSRACFLRDKFSYDQHSVTTGFSGFCTEVLPLQSELVQQYVLRAFKALGCDLHEMNAGEEVVLKSYDPTHRKLVQQLYKILGDAGIVDINDDCVPHRTTKLAPVTPVHALHSRMLDRFPKHASETKLLHTTAHRLADCLTGEADPLALMFGDSAARALLEDVYTNAPMFKTGTLLLSQYLSSVIEGLGGAREVRILELGAGTGGTTKYLVEKLAGLGGRHRFSYTFTDLSPSLVAAARRKFARWPFMQYAVLNVEQQPEPELVGAYDIIISINCIHATQDLRRSATNIHTMLRPDGILCLVELTRNLFWFDLVFGLLEGWWLSTDGRKHALADESQWEHALRAAGFEWIDWSHGTTKESDVLRVITASPHQDRPSHTGIDTNSKPQSHTSLELQQTITYKEVDGLNLQADIYFPSEAADLQKSLPVAIMIHGGGHIMLSRNEIRPEQTQSLLNSGFLPISIDYRLCPETTLPEGPMADVVDALAWARKVLPLLSLNRKDVRVDAEKVVSVGWSTGGHLAMSLGWSSVARGLRPPEAILAFYCPTDYEDPFWTLPNIPVGSEPTAMGALHRSSPYELDDDIWSGVYNRPITGYNVSPRKRALGGWLASGDQRSRLALHMNWHGRTLQVLLGGLDKRTQSAPRDPSPEAVRAVSPLAQIRQGGYTTPTFLVHPRDDDLIPWQQSSRTMDALCAAGIDADIRIVEDVPHLFDMYAEHMSDGAARQAVRDGYRFLCRHAGLELYDERV